MGFRDWYDEKVLPHIIRCGCANEHIMALRAKVVPLAAGRVFEMGAGGGLNQRFYDRAKVTDFAGLDPSGKLLEHARAAAHARGWEADIRQGFGEAIPFEDRSFDTVVCTFTMCSVSDQSQVLIEMRRILKPGGRLLFLEHGRAPDPGVYRWQRRIEPTWRKLFGNCHISREVAPAVARHGFVIEQVDHKYMERTPRLAGFMEWGVARRSGD
ncbi:MAG TPA: class I SAM-dependent methyltransferase [Pseudomonadales bacterium]|nr:class I SAM-dependent methyltransferase [Pseudomonadales bacterium]